MRTVAVATLLTGTLMAISGVPVIAAVSTTQHLPVAVCNAGTMNAHERVPETTGTGVTTPAHAAIPGTANVRPCGHGG